MSAMASTRWRATSSSASFSAASLKPARRPAIGFADSARFITVRLRVCSGGSASRIRLGGRHGLVRRKSSIPTPAAELNVCQSLSAACTSAWRAHAHSP